MPQTAADLLSEPRDSAAANAVEPDDVSLLQEQKRLAEAVSEEAPLALGGIESSTSRSVDCSLVLKKVFLQKAAAQCIVNRMTRRKLSTRSRESRTFARLRSICRVNSLRHSGQRMSDC